MRDAYQAHRDVLYTNHVNVVGLLRFGLRVKFCWTVEVNFSKAQDITTQRFEVFAKFVVAAVLQVSPLNPSDEPPFKEAAAQKRPKTRGRLRRFAVAPAWADLRLRQAASACSPRPRWQQRQEPTSVRGWQLRGRLDGWMDGWPRCDDV